MFTTDIYFLLYASNPYTFMGEIWGEAFIANGMMHYSIFPFIGLWQLVYYFYLAIKFFDVWWFYGFGSVFAVLRAVSNISMNIIYGYYSEMLFFYYIS